MGGFEENDLVFLYANEGIVVSDSKGRIVRINPSCAQLFGYNQDELMGSSIEKLVPPRLVEQHRSDREKFHNHPHVRAFGQRSGLVGLHKDGHEIPLEISLSPFEVLGEHFVISFVVDNTYRIQAEQQLRQYAEQLERDVHNRTLILQEAVDQLEHTKAELSQALAKEKELNHLKTRFVSIASHEFRTPLATILSSISLIKKYADLGELEKRDKHIERVKSSIASLNDVLDEFLSLSKLEEGVVENNPVACDLQDLLDRLLEEFRSTSEHEIELVFTGDREVVVDTKHLKTVLSNLIINALKYSPPEKSVTVRVSVGATDIGIQIQDQGIGIPEADVPHVFERFFRAKNVMHIKGSGLGLNIVSRFVEVMGGTMSLLSKENEGTLVTLHLPR